MFLRLEFLKAFCVCRENDQDAPFLGSLIFEFLPALVEKTMESASTRKMSYSAELCDRPRCNKSTYLYVIDQAD